MQDRVTRKGYAFYFCYLDRDLNPRLSPCHTAPPLTLTPPTPPRARVHLRFADARTGGGALRRLCRIPQSGMRLVRARSPKAGLRIAAFGKVEDKSGKLKAASVGCVRKPAASSMPYRSPTYTNAAQPHRAHASICGTQMLELEAALCAASAAYRFAVCGSCAHARRKQGCELRCLEKCEISRGN